jgi:hypothetical protein
MDLIFTVLPVTGKNSHRLAGVYVTTQRAGRRLAGDRLDGELTVFYVTTQKNSRSPSCR